MQIGFCLALLDRHEEAQERANIAIGLDPFSILNLWYVTLIPWTFGDVEKVLIHGKTMIDLEPNFFSGHLFVGLAYTELRQFHEAIKELELAIKLSPGVFTWLWLGFCYGLMGDKLKAREVIKKMEDFEEVGNCYIGLVYASMGEFDAAFIYFDKAVENQEGYLLWLKFNIRKSIPTLLKDDRTKNLMERLKVPF